MIVAGWLHAPSFSGLVPLARTRAQSREPLAWPVNVVLLALHEPDIRQLASTAGSPAHNACS